MQCMLSSNRWNPSGSGSSCSSSSFSSSGLCMSATGNFFSFFFFFVSSTYTAVFGFHSPLFMAALKVFAFSLCFFNSSAFFCHSCFTKLLSICLWDSSSSSSGSGSGAFFRASSRSFSSFALLANILAVLS